MNTQSVTTGLPPVLHRPPPCSATLFPENVQFRTVRPTVSEANIPPPSSTAEFPEKAQFVTVGLPPQTLIPPPSSPLLPAKTQSFTVGLPPEEIIPAASLSSFVRPPGTFRPPPAEPFSSSTNFAAVTLKPSRTVAAPMSSLARTTQRLFVPTIRSALSVTPLTLFVSSSARSPVRAVTFAAGFRSALAASAPAKPP